MKTVQELRQNQNLVITQELRTAISLLQFSQLELLEFLETQNESNPFLEIERRGSNETSFEKKQEVSFVKYVLEQINYLPYALQKSAKLLSYYLNEYGYLEGNLPEIAAENNVSCDLLEKTLKHLHSMEPVGIFARSFAENITLQLKETNSYTEEMQLIVQNIECFRDADLNKLSKKTGLSVAECKALLQIIKTLRPYPSWGFQQENHNDIWVVPDIIAKKTNNRWTVELNPEACPRLHFLEQEFKTIERRALPKEKGFFQQQLRHSNWLIKALAQRYSTLLQVSKMIIEEQSDFLEQGPLKPMLKKDIALRLGFHESTISRITTNKYIATPRGTLELKEFFSQSIQDCSSKEVQCILKSLIAKEPKNNPLSDEHLADALAIKGILLARRTVTKYRELMNIPKSTVRKRQQQLNVS